MGVAICPHPSTTSSHSSLNSREQCCSASLFRCSLAQTGSSLQVELSCGTPPDKKHAHGGGGMYELCFGLWPCLLFWLLVFRLRLGFLRVAAAAMSARLLDTAARHTARLAPFSRRLSPKPSRIPIPIPSNPQIVKP